MSDILERGLRLLELVATERLSPLELAGELGVSRATIFRMLSTLETLGYVQRGPQARDWTIGPTVHRIAAGAAGSSLADIASETLDQLHAESRETINLAGLHRSRLRWADTREGTYPLRLSTTVGEDVPLHATAVGKAILSALPRGQWVSMLPPEPYPSITPRTKTTLAALEVDVLSAAERGWAIDEEESEPSGVCVAAAIHSKTRVVGAISLSSVSGRMPPHEIERWGRRVASAASALSEAISV